MAKPRKIIGVFVDWTEDLYQQTILKGIMERARETDTNCIVFEGGSLNSNREYEAKRNLIYDLANKSCIDGIIMFNASMSQFIPYKGTVDFCNRYADIPKVSISMRVDGVPSILIDNLTGMKRLVTHLVEEHGFKRFAFIKGKPNNQDAIDRFDIFRKTLDSYGIKVEQSLVFEGNFNERSGAETVRLLLDERKLFCDVIVASNDNMALGALDELKRRGIAVPDEIAVTGFDNLEVCGVSTPTLTTVKQPIYELGKMSMTVISDMIEGREIPVTTVLETVPVIRESCKCQSRQVSNITAMHKDRFKPRARSEEMKALAYSGIAHKIKDLFYGIPFSEVQKLVSSTGTVLLSNETRDNPTIFPRTIEGIITNPAFDDIEVSAFETLVSELRYDLIPFIPDAETRTVADDACFNAILRISAKSGQREWKAKKELLKESQVLNLIREELLMTLDMTKQMDVLAQYLPALGISTCYVSLYKGDPAPENGRAVCILAYNDNKRMDKAGDVNFFSRKLVPDDFLVSGKRYTVIIEGLKHLGYVILEMGERQGRIFALLGDVISSAIHSALLFAEVQNQRNGLSLSLTNMRKAMAGFIHTMALTVETRDPYTAGHQRRVSDLARTIAQEMRLAQNTIEGVRMAGIIHDLGKIYVPSEILNRPGKLDEIELSMIRRHPKIAYEILKNVDFPWPIADIVHQHHERMNGSGYPNGLAGDAICVEAKILAVADVVEAMAWRRPYREALGIDKALEEITKNKGTLYDASVVNTCVRLFREKGYEFSRYRYERDARLSDEK